MDGKKQTQAFPLDFNAKSWTLEEAVCSVFFGSTPTRRSLEWVRVTKFILAKLANSDVLPNGSPSQPTMKTAISLLRFLRRLSTDWKSDLELPPVVWSRLAIQYWLLHGGRQELFMKSFVSWLKNSENIVVVMESVSLGGQTIEGAQIREVGLPVFLFDPTNLKRVIQRRVILKAIRRGKSGGGAVTKGGEDAIEKMLGVGLYRCVKGIVEDAIQSGGISNLSSKRDPKSGRYQFTGRHVDLYKDICRQYKKETEQYSRSTLSRAIRALVAPRRSWTGIV